MHNPHTHLAVVFPGQGSQGPQMGTAWRDHPAWDVVHQAEEVLGETPAQLSRPLSEILVDEPAGPQGTVESQLAIVVAGMVRWRALQDVLAEPVVLSGHSLGMATALHAAGCLSVADAVRVTALRVQATNDACTETAGGMVALPLPYDQAALACAGVDGCWVANDNAPEQTVIAGTDEGLAEASARARDLGAPYARRLNVAGAFHSPLMAEARKVFGEGLKNIAFAEHHTIVVHNGTMPGNGHDWREALASDLTAPVLWRSTMQRIVDYGIRTIVECGHGRVLTGLSQRCAPELERFMVGGPADLAVLGWVA